jgi:hypothetical protein
MEGPDQVLLLNTNYHQKPEEAATPSALHWRQSGHTFAAKSCPKMRNESRRDAQSCASPLPLAGKWPPRTTHYENTRVAIQKKEQAVESATAARGWREPTDCGAFHGATVLPVLLLASREPHHMPDHCYGNSLPHHHSRVQRYADSLLHHPSRVQVLLLASWEPHHMPDHCYADSLLHLPVLLLASREPYHMPDHCYADSLLHHHSRGQVLHNHHQHDSRVR